MPNPTETQEIFGIEHALVQIGRKNNDWVEYRRLVLSEIKRLSDSYTDLAEFVNHRNELTESRLVDLETEATVLRNVATTTRDVTIRQEIALDARKLALIGGFFSVITVIATVLSRLFFGG